MAKFGTFTFGSKLFGSSVDTWYGLGDMGSDKGIAKKVTTDFEDELKASSDFTPVARVSTQYDRLSGEVYDASIDYDSDQYYEGFARTSRSVDYTKTAKQNTDYSIESKEETEYNKSTKDKTRWS